MESRRNRQALALPGLHHDAAAQLMGNLQCSFDSGLRQLRGAISGLLPLRPRPLQDGSQLVAQQARARRPARATLRSAAPFAAVIPGDSIVEGVITSGLQSFLSLYNTAIIIRLVCTWFPQIPAQVVGPLATVTDPYLNLFRGIIPPLGGTIDLSPILAFVALDLFTNTAQALPSEVGPEGRRVARQRRFRVLSPTAAACAWQQRLAAQRCRAKQAARAASQRQ